MSIVIDKDSQEDEWMVLAFNGTNHVYCTNDECGHEAKYKVFLAECTQHLRARWQSTGEWVQHFDIEYQPSLLTSILSAKGKRSLSSHRASLIESICFQC